MLDPAIAPYLVSALLFCLGFLFIIMRPRVITLANRIDELTRIGDEEDQPDPHAENPPEDMTEAYLNRRPR
jgi:hypothetical protein